MSAGLKRNGSDPMQQLTGIDASFIYLETPRAPMHIGGVIFCRPPHGGFDFRRYFDLIESRLHRSSVFRRRLITVPFGIDQPYWLEDPDFNLESHVHHMGLPAPGGWAELRRLVEHILSIPLDMRRPLWSFTFVEGLDGIDLLPKGSFALIHKLHHAAVDGMGGSDLLSALFDLTPDPPIDGSMDNWVPEMRPGPIGLLGKAYLNLLGHPKKIGRTIGAIAKGTWNLGKEVLVEKQTLPTAPFRGPRTRFNSPISAQRVFGGVWLPLSDVKAIKHHVEGATVNDVVLAVCAGAVRGYLDDKDELPDKTLTAMVPISVRDTVEGGGNQVSAMLVPLATDEQDALTRLGAIRESTVRTKEQSKAMGASTLTDAAQIVPFSLGAAAARLYSRMEIARYVRPLFNLIITNVPGPRQTLYFGGGQLVGSMGMAPIIDGLGLILVITSYDDYLTISVTSCPDRLPDVEFFENCLRDSFVELQSATIGVPAKTKPRRAGKAGIPRKSATKKSRAASAKTSAAAKKRPAATRKATKKNKAAATVTRGPARRAKSKNRKTARR
jgi:WS/DGAT/MGAT family acyltransferase